jgi:hypothetical protein
MFERTRGGDADRGRAYQDRDVCKNLRPGGTPGGMVVEQV